MDVSLGNTLESNQGFLESLNNVGARDTRDSFEIWQIKARFKVNEIQKLTPAVRLNDPIVDFAVFECPFYLYPAWLAFGIVHSIYGKSLTVEQSLLFIDICDAIIPIDFLGKPPENIVPAISRKEFMKWRFEKSMSANAMSVVNIENMQIPLYLQPSFIEFMDTSYPMFMKAYNCLPTSIFLEFLQVCETILPLVFIEGEEIDPMHTDLYVPSTNLSRKWGM